MQRRIYLFLLGLIFIMSVLFYILSGLWFESAAVFLAALAGAGFVSKFAADGFVRSLEGLEKDDSAVYIYDEFVPYLRKVNRMKDDLKLQIDTLKYRTAIIETITRHMNEGLVLMDKSGQILVANERASGIFALETIRENILHICRDADFQACVKTCLGGTRCETRLVRDKKVYNVFADPVFNNGELNGGTVLFFDITHFLAAEKQRREFSANVSHELKTPLTTISGLAEMLAQGMVAREDVTGFAGKIYTQAAGLMDIINDIIGLSELDEGGADKRLEEFNLGDMIEAVAEGLRVKADAKNVEIIINAGDVVISSDRRLTETLLRNLIDNAVKYNKDGGTVTVSADSLGTPQNATAALQENVAAPQRLVAATPWVLTVEDTGIGIPPDDINRVFERFYRVEKSRNKKTGGTGLGLSIVKHIMEHLNGWVELESDVGKGTKISCGVGKR